MGAARRAHPLLGSGPHSPRRSASPRSHPARSRGVPDDGGFYEVCSRRFGRPRPSPPRSPPPVPPELRGLCFNCLQPGHVRAQCRSKPRCYNCRMEGHRVARCPFPPRGAIIGHKRGRSPPAASWPGLAQGGPAKWQHRPSSASTISACSASTQGSFAVPRCCEPPTPPSPPPPQSPLPPPSLTTSVRPEQPLSASTAPGAGADNAAHMEVARADGAGARRRRTGSLVVVPRTEEMQFF